MSASELNLIQAELSERVDAAAFAPQYWDEFLLGIQELLPDLRVGLEAHDTTLDRPIAVGQRGWGERETQDYIDHFAAVSPWQAAWSRLPLMEPYFSESVLPLRELKKTEFYCDWLGPIGDAEVGTGIKLLASEGRMARLYIHFGTRHMEEHHAIFAAILGRVAPRMRSALLTNRLLASATPLRPKGSIMDSLIDPAFLLAPGCRLVSVNAAGQALLGEQRLIEVGAGDLVRLRDERQHRVFAAAVEALCRGGSRQPSPDVPLLEGALSWTLSLLPVAREAVQGLPAPSVELFLPRALVLAVLRPAAATATPPTGELVLPDHLTNAERRLVEALCQGGTLQEIAARLGIAYETARSRLKTIFAKTGAHSQRDLLAQLMRREGSKGR